MGNPYSSAKDYQLWHKSVSAPFPGHIDPVTRSRRISKSDRISTMGSCFAQHLSRNIAAGGFNYYVAEPNDAAGSASDPSARNYGVFSARYGNIYTARQGLQLFDRAFGRFPSADDHVWTKNGRFFDAFRPQAEPGGFASADALAADREHHLSCVRSIFETSRWLIFTLGLTEAWTMKSDGAVLPVAPGVAAGEYDPARHQFVNFSFGQVRDDLSQFIERAFSVNDEVEILLTVSPVPLVATYEDRHVLASTTLSKSILRAVADEMERKFDRVIYFPSYEIITSAANSARYFEDDLRQVNELGVSHVMRLFRKHFLTGADSPASAPSRLEPAGINPAGIICDEEMIATSLQAAGFAADRA